jgi:hypothetical protein
MSQSEEPIVLTAVKGSLVSEDGRQVKLKCLAYDGTEKELIIPTRALRNVVINLQILSTSAEIIMETTHDDLVVPVVKFDEPEPVFFVTKLGGMARPETGLVQLRVGQLHGPNFQLSMQKAEARVLFDLLLDLFATDDSKSN